jgi:hypothetical protein
MHLRDLWGPVRPNDPTRSTFHPMLRSSGPERLADNIAVERDVLHERVPRPQRELEAFKQKVLDVATEYATEHNRCSVIDQALQELGVEAPAGELHSDARDHC